MKKHYKSNGVLGQRKRKSGKHHLLLMLFVIMSPLLHAQQTYSFTPGAATSSLGPTQLQINTAYLSTNLAAGLPTSVTIIGLGAQQWTVPTSGLYRIETYGAQGGGSTGGPNTGTIGGLGAIMKGDFNLTAGQVFTIVVGQAGGTTPYGGGGGGGSYVVTGANVPLCIAGGGGGAYGYVGDARGTNVGYPGLISTAGGTSNVPGGPTYGYTAPGSGGGAPGYGGTNGYGGGSGVAAGGGGLLGDGANGGAITSIYDYGGKSFVNGSGGGGGTAAACNGGFGGGGGAQAGTGYGGGGGGYSGGGGGSLVGTPQLLSGNGGGGGSFNSGTNQTNTAGANAGNGKVIFTELCNMSLIATGTNSNGAICTGNSVTLTTNAVSNYSWSAGLPSASVVVVSPTITTTYTLSATTVSNCTAYGSVTITVDPGVPSLTITNTANSGGICPTRSVALTASGATSYTWTGGSPTVTNGVTFNPTATSGYTVTGLNACGSSTAATSVSIHPFPTVNPVASTSSLCSGASLTLTAVGNATNYTWSGGSAPGGNGVGFNPPLTATYTVIGTSALSCTASATIPVTVVATPNAPSTALPSLICIGKSSTLTATGATNYTWTSSAATVNTSTFVVTPAAPGITTYTITRSNSNCITTQFISVTTNSLPTIFAIVTPTIVCALNSATLAIGGAQTYTWLSPGPPSFSFTGASPVVSPPVPTTYTVSASDGTCISITTVFLAVNPNPTLLTTGSSSAICNGQTVTVNVTGGINYTWTNTANTNTYNTPSVTDSPTTAVSYNVVGDNSFGCTSSASQIVLVNPNPTITISATKTLVCSGGPSTLTASGANSYTWDPNANNALTNTVIVNPTSPTSGFVLYTVEGKYAATGCRSTKAIAISVFVPTLTITGNTNTCFGGGLSLSASGGNNGSYSWNLGTGNPYTFPTLNTTLSAPAIFTVSATTTSISVNCPVSQTVSVGIYYNPTITAVPQRTPICKTESVDLYANGGVTYQWSNAMTGATINVNPTINTTYTVTGTDANGCVNTGTVLVKVSGCNGVNELRNSNGGLIVYPNPNNGEFMIQSNEAISLTLVNELGQTVRIISLTGSNNYKVSVTDLAKGIYFITGQKDAAFLNEKIVVTH